LSELRGVIPPIPTYLAANGSLDRDAHRRAVTRVIEGRVDGVLVLGTAGEGAVLNAELRAAALAEAVKVAGDAPVIAGCAAHTVEAALTQLWEAADLGAAAALLLPPFYYRLGQDALAAMFETIADASPIDFALYHIPALTGNGFTPGTVARLAQHPRIVGIKDSARDFAYHLQLRRSVEREGFRVFEGAAPLLYASAAAGGTDSICPVTALLPGWEREMRDALRAGDQPAAAAAGDRITAMSRLFNLGEVPMPANFKAIAALMGLGPARPHEPAFAPDDAHRQLLADGLRALGLDVPTTTTGEEAA
jgi:4-hydroxy-tetrahydrodipicolinate synthase